MSQPHPPIPEPQSHPHDGTDDEGPRTQSILLPPSQRQTEQPPPAAEQTAVWGAPSSPEQPLPGQPAPAQVTGPLGFVPGLTERPATSGSSAATSPPRVPGPPTTPGGPSLAPPDTPSEPSRRSRPAVPRTGRSRAVLLALGLAVLALVLLELGLALDYGNQSLWEVVPTWSAFATVAALVVLVAVLGALTGRLPGRTASRVGAAGLAALAAAWVLVALPLAASDRGFWLTAALGAAGAAWWLTPGRSE